jgi:hypothetical protein
VSGWSVYFKDKNKILFPVRPPVEDKKIKNFLYLHNPINHSAVVFDKDLILGEGGYNEEFNTYEDFELWLRLKNKLKFAIIPEVLVYTRLHDDSMTKKGSKKEIYELLRLNAESNLNNPDLMNKKKYRNNIFFWIEYFYGDKAKARKHLGNEISFKQAIAFLNTFLPEKAFDKIMGLRLRFRLMSKLEDKKLFEEELKKLISL